MKSYIEFSNYMTLLGEIFGKEISDSLKTIYWEILKPYSDKQCIEAFKKAISLCKFYPKPAELIEFLAGKTNQAEANKAQIEVDKIISNLKFYGATKYPDLTDPITKHLMTKRWPYKNWAANVIESELKWWVKEFCEAYNAYQSTGDVPVKIEVQPNVLKLVESVGS